MNLFTKTLRLKLDEELRAIERSAENSIQIADQSYQAVEQALKSLKEFVLEYEFENAEEEIYFFKEIKTDFMQDAIYYLRLFYIESHKPAGSLSVITEYYNISLNGIGLFFERNQALYTYFRTGNTRYDREYFLRGNDSLAMIPEYILDIDSRFSTIYSLKFAKIKAYERLGGYLHNALHELQYGNMKVSMKQGGLKWTDSKVALIELAYALHARGAVDSGKAGIKQLISSLENAFNVELVNFYRVFMDISLRKKNRTPYLDSLKEYLDRYMIEGDR